MALCRGLLTADAIGWLKLGPEWTLEVPGEGKCGEDHTRKNTTHAHTHKLMADTKIYPGSGPS